jgi:hypothetical protein
MNEVVKEVLKECESRYGVDCSEMIKEYEIEDEEVLCLAPLTLVPSATSERVKDVPPSIIHPSMTTDVKEKKRLEKEAKQLEKEMKRLEKDAEKDAKRLEKEAKKEAKAKKENLIKLTAKEKKYVISEWHHANLSYIELHPTEDNRYEDVDLTKEEIEEIIKRYGIEPPRYHWYWNDDTGARLDTPPV